MLKLINLLFIKKGTKKTFDYVGYRIFHNEVHVPGWKGICYKNKSIGKKVIRSKVTPAYETFFILNHVKGFSTHYFKSNYDVIVTDRHGEVIDLLINVQPDYISINYESAYYISLSPVGTINFLNLKEKDRLYFERIVNFELLEAF